MPRLLQSLGTIGNLSYHHRKFLLGPKECPVISLRLRHLQPAEACNCKRKKCYVGRHWLPKKIHFNKLLVYHFVIPASPSVALDEVTLQLMQVDNRQWQRNAGNHPFPGTLSLKSVSLFYSWEFFNRQLDTQLPLRKYFSGEVSYPFD
jgi:hypothetical protein